jgi:hypothetical protein
MAQAEEKHEKEYAEKSSEKRSTRHRKQNDKKFFAETGFLPSF